MRSLILLAAVAGTTLLGGCVGGTMFHHAGPDEFAVQREQPLVVPPDFALSPPKQGEPRPVTDRGTAQQETLDALFGGPAPRSDVEKDAISRAGESAPGIRSTVGDTKTYAVAKGSVTRDILAAPQGDGREAQTGIVG